VVLRWHGCTSGACGDLLSNAKETEEKQDYLMKPLVLLGITCIYGYEGVSCFKSTTIIFKSFSGGEKKITLVRLKWIHVHENP